MTISLRIDDSGRAGRLSRRIVILLTSFLMLSVALADEGNDHDSDIKIPLPMQLQPRIVANSERIELVGILDKTTLTFFLDDFETNKPMENITLSIYSRGEKMTTLQQSEGHFVHQDKRLALPGAYELFFLVSADNWSEKLTAILIVPKVIPTSGQPNNSLQLITIILILISILGMGIWWGVKRSKKSFLLGTGITIIIGLGISWDTSFGDAGHDKENSTTISNVVNKSTRLVDGSLFVPKPIQRLLRIRTKLVKKQQLPISLELNGHVIPNPNYSGLIQSTQAARIDTGNLPFPYVGQKVKVGQLLTRTTPVADALDIGNQRARFAELTAELDLAKKALKRVKQLKDSISQKKVEEAYSRVESVIGRKSAVAKSIHQHQNIYAPVSGVISQVEVRPGQIVEARDTLFEIIDPNNLWVEALTYDVPLANQGISAGAYTLNGSYVPLVIRGTGVRLQNHAARIVLEIATPSPVLSVEQPLTVWIITRQQISGMLIPADSIRKNIGKAHVWVHLAPERFVLKKVDYKPFDSQQVIVVDGLTSGVRVVTEGAGLLEQFR